MKSRKDLNIGLNEERRLKQLNLNLGDAQRKTTYMEKEVDHIIERWQGRLLIL